MMANRTDGDRVCNGCVYCMDVSPVEEEARPRPRRQRGWGKTHLCLISRTMNGHVPEDCDRTPLSA
jgi:hypothetical protein